MCNGECGAKRAGAAAGAAALGEAYSRRDFLARSTAAAAAALVLSACGDGVFGGGITGPDATALGNGTYTINLTDYPSLRSVGGIAAVPLPTGGRIGVGRTGADAFAGYGLACTHQGTTVQASGSIWICPNHGAEFDVSGAVVRGPANAPLVAITTTYDAAAGTLTFNGADSVAQQTPTNDDDDGEGEGD